MEELTVRNSCLKCMKQYGELDLNFLKVAGRSPCHFDPKRSRRKPHRSRPLRYSVNLPTIRVVYGFE